MLDCIDSFKTGECGCGCGCVPCLNNRPPLGPKCRSLPAPVIVHDNKGQCVPVLHDPNHLFSHSCKRPKGGDMTVRAPLYALTVENPPDGVLRDAEGFPVLDAEGNVQAENAVTQHC